MGPRRAQGRRDREAARGSRSSAAASARRAAGGGLWLDRRRARSVDEGCRRGLCRLEQANVDERAQSLVRACYRRQPTARGLRTAAEAELCDATESAAAELRILLLARRCGARQLQALPRQQLARGLRSA